MSKKINKVPTETQNIFNISEEKKNKLRHTIRNLELKEEVEIKGILEGLIKNDTLVEQREKLKKSLSYHLRVEVVSLLLMLFVIAPSLYFNKLLPLDGLSFSVGAFSFIFFLNSLWFSGRKLTQFLKIDKEIQNEKKNLSEFLKEKNISLKDLVDELNEEKNIKPYRNKNRKINPLNIEEGPSTSTKYSNPIQKKRRLSNDMLKKLKDRSAFLYKNSKKPTNKVAPWR